MVRTICIAAIVLAWSACSGEKDSKPANKKSSKPTSPKTAKKTPTKSSAKKTPTKSTVVKAKKPGNGKPKILASTPGTALRAWASKQGVSKKRVMAKKLPKAVTKELRTFAKAIGGKQAQVSWAHVLTPNTKKDVPALGLCFGYVDKSGADPVRQFWFAAVTFEKDAYVVRRAVKTERTQMESANNTWSFDEMRDVDGDGHKDIVLSYTSSASQAKWRQSKNGTVLIGSRGDAIEIITSSSSLDNEAGTSSAMVAKLWFTSVADKPALLIVEENESADKVTALYASEDGHFKTTALFSIVHANFATTKLLSQVADRMQKKYHPNLKHMFKVRVRPKVVALTIGLEFSVQRVKAQYRKLLGYAPRGTPKYVVSSSEPYKRPE